MPQVDRPKSSRREQSKFNGGPCNLTCCRKGGDLAEAKCLHRRAVRRKAKASLRLQELLSFKNDEHPCGLLNDLAIGAGLLHEYSGEIGFAVGNRLLRLKERLEMELSKGDAG